MNGQNESPGDRADEPEGNRQAERLNQIEHRLRQARPRRPNLDAMALERMARSVLADPGGDRPAAVTAAGPRGDRRRRPARSLAIVASAWACGAVVGSLATMLLAGRTGASGDQSGPAARNEQRLSPPTASKEPAVAVAPPLEHRNASPPRNAVQPDKDAPVLAMLADPWGSGRWWHGIESSTLRAGMHLAKDTGAASDILPPGTLTAKQAPPGAGSPQAETWKKSEPAPFACPEITREQILDDVLREMSGAVL